jgi:hypothetical protein
MDRKRLVVEAPPNITAAPLNNGEVEVITVDVRLANKVRCSNNSIAEDVAKMLKIPIRRITVTPWSWSLPDPLQSKYLAFVQEDHERCECEGVSGQGFRKVKSATEGWMIAPDTSVMTVSQFEAMQRGHKSNSDASVPGSACFTAGTLKCDDSVSLTAISPAECPADTNIKKCDEAEGGELCDGDGECGTDPALNNCGAHDVYRKCAPPPAPAPVFTSTPAMCKDGLPLTAIAFNECPTNGDLRSCDAVGENELCEGDGECGTNDSLNNCGHHDVYRKCVGPPPSALSEGKMLEADDDSRKCAAADCTAPGNIKCYDGLKLNAIPKEACPHNMNFASLPKCDVAKGGELCNGDGECGTDPKLNNCGSYDIYRKCMGPAFLPSAMMLLDGATCTHRECRTKCLDGFRVAPVLPIECPADSNILACNDVKSGELCEGNGECGTDQKEKNCGERDIYRKCKDPMSYGRVTLRTKSGKFAGVDVDALGNWKIRIGSKSVGPLELFDVQYYTEGHHGPLDYVMNLPGKHVMTTLSFEGKHLIAEGMHMVVDNLGQGSGEGPLIRGAGPSPRQGPEDVEEVHLVLTSEDGMVFLMNQHGEYIVEKDGEVGFSTSKAERLLVDIAPVQDGAPNCITPHNEAPPKSRVQMLTRDPCLVHLLREATPHFQKEVASCLGMPQDKLILDPPPVKGTIGFMQLDTTLNSETESQQVPVLGVHECNPADLADRLQHLSLVSLDSETIGEMGTELEPAPEPEPAPGPSPFFAPSPDLPVFSVVNETSMTAMATNTTNATTPQRVHLAMKLFNLDYDLLTASWPLVSSFTTVMKLAIGITAHVPRDAIKMAIYPGSVMVEAKIMPPPNTAATAVEAFLNGTVCEAAVARLNTLVSLEKAKIGELDCSILELYLEDPPFEADESNRPWIAFWNVVFPPPLPQEGAWRLLQQVNEPGTCASKLLPMTLARIPGMQYRAMQDPNEAIKGSKEVRLPPPSDKAVGFTLPNPYDEQTELEWSMKKMARDQAAHEKDMQTKNEMELAMATASIQQSDELKERIQKARSRSRKRPKHMLMRSELQVQPKVLRSCPTMSSTLTPAIQVGMNHLTHGEINIHQQSI